jgi:hypothetical protein
MGSGSSVTLPRREEIRVFLPSSFVSQSVIASEMSIASDRKGNFNETFMAVFMEVDFR